MDKELLYNLNIMIKPISSDCNIDCKYCFYKDEAINRTNKSYGPMSYDTLENLVKNAFSSVGNNISFLFQGGEPTLRGIDFFEQFHKFVNKYNTNDISVNFSIQTNGIILDDAWINLFRKYNYLVGISLDGTKDCHDYYRTDHYGKGTFSRVMKNIKLLMKEGISLNILTVVNDNTCDYAEEIYNFYKKNNFYFLQFIPVINPLSKNYSKNYRLDPLKYGMFLDRLFNIRYRDILNGNFRSIRYYENLLMIILGQHPESCDTLGHCSINPIVESDGKVYPCDFYCLDQEEIGNINHNSIIDIISSNKANIFLSQSYKIADTCKECKYVQLCKGGCKRYKNTNLENELCSGFYYFFKNNYEKLIGLADYIKKIQFS
ncbi:MAG: anaerobic sulfatase maturase [Anaerococcus sp.]|nr:anaerobic sulfatase maturase [Peptoniphilaceae bacterium]MDY3054761.1 anaerobic sulfatase maturase [Anaerococcus sp.]